MAAAFNQTRRAPRVPARCPAEVKFGAGRWNGLTEDLGAGGCRIVARIALRPGELVSLKLSYTGVREALDVVGTVAWTASRPPWRAGVAFARGQESKAKRFVKAVLAAAPELTAPPTPNGGFRLPDTRPAPAPAPTPPPRALLGPPAARLEALLLAARSLAAVGSQAEAVRSLREALELDPGNVRALSLLRVLGVRGD
jgi:tetratricopeptide (TPR) repeat protein